MRKRFHFIGVITLAVLTLFTSSCSSDDDKDEWSAEFTYSLYCTENLLDFVTPVVTFVDENGAEQTMSLTKEMFEKSEDGGEANGNPSLVWKKEIVFDHWKVTSKMFVKYEKRNDAPKMDEFFGEPTLCCYYETKFNRKIKDQSPEISQGINLININNIGGNADNISELLTMLNSRHNELVYYVDEEGIVTTK